MTFVALFLTWDKARILRNFYCLPLTLRHQSAPPMECVPWGVLAMQHGFLIPAQSTCEPPLLVHLHGICLARKPERRSFRQKNGGRKMKTRAGIKSKLAFMFLPQSFCQTPLLENLP